MEADATRVPVCCLPARSDTRQSRFDRACVRATGRSISASSRRYIDKNNVREYSSHVDTVRSRGDGPRGRRWRWFGWKPVPFCFTWLLTHAKRPRSEGAFHMSGWSASEACEWSFGIPSSQRLVTMAMAVGCLCVSAPVFTG